MNEETLDWYLDSLEEESVDTEYTDLFDWEDNQSSSLGHYGDFSALN